MAANPYVDPTTGEWVGEHETRDADGEITRETEWFDSEEAARRFAETGEWSCAHEGEHHSDDRVTVYHGGTEPVVLCGFHAQPPIDFSKVRKGN